MFLINIYNGTLFKVKQDGEGNEIALHEKSDLNNSPKVFDILISDNDSMFHEGTGPCFAETKRPRKESLNQTAAQSSDLDTDTLEYLMEPQSSDEEIPMTYEISLCNV